MTKKSIYKKSILFIHQLLPPSLWGPCSWPHICLQETLCFHGCWTERRDNITYSKSQGRQARKEWISQVGKPDSIIYRIYIYVLYGISLSVNAKFRCSMLSFHCREQISCGVITIERLIKWDVPCGTILFTIDRHDLNLYWCFWPLSIVHNIFGFTFSIYCLADYKEI